MDKLSKQIQELVKKSSIDYDDFLKLSKEEIIQKLSVYHEELVFQNDELKNSNLELERVKNLYHDLFNESPVPILEIDQAFNILTSNLSAKEFLNSTLKGKSFQEFIDSDYQDSFYLNMRKFRTDNLQDYKLQLRLIIDDEVHYVTVFANRVDLSIDSHIRLAVIDHSEEKKYQDKIEYLANHDQLTGVGNRRKFDNDTERIISSNSTLIGVIYFDLDNLKLINDAFGHSKGDDVLAKITDNVVEELQFNDSIYRIGGDEFVVFIFGDSKRFINLEMKRLKSIIQTTSVDDFEITASVGISFNKSSHDIMSAIKEAEENMYNEKMVANKSGKLNIISSILNALHGKYPIEEGHSNRVAILMEQLAIALGYDAGMQSKYRSAGMLHDIGKIAINYQSLQEKKKLTDLEFEEIKKHPEIGYKILLSSRVEPIITEAVLLHHERVDGKGYPKGYSGEEIPYMARALNICDSFDAMVSERHYKTSLTVERAVQELTDCAGGQFYQELTEVFIEKVVPKIKRYYQ